MTSGKKLNFEKDVLPLIRRMNIKYRSVKCEESLLHMEYNGTEWIILNRLILRSTVAKQENCLMSGTLRECYCFLLGMNEILKA